MTQFFRSRCGLACMAVALIALSPPAWAATRTFDFNGPEYGNADELCGNNPVPPLFNHPEFGAYTGYYIWGDVLPRGATTGCGHGIIGVDSGNCSLLTAGIGDPNNLLRFSWDYETMDATWSFPVAGANWTASGNRLTLTDGFTDYTFVPGDIINITAGTGVTTGDVRVASKVSSSAISLAESICATDVTDGSIAGTIRRNMDVIWANISTSLFSYTNPIFASPTVDITPGSSISMQITSRGFDATETEVPTAVLEYSLLIQETDKNLPLGENGGTNGPIELAGVDDILPGARTPVGGVPLTERSDAVYDTIVWTFVDRDIDGNVDGVDVTVTPGGGTPTVYNKGIKAFANGNGILSTPSKRATLAGLAIRKPTTDTTTRRWYVWVDNIIIDAPGITDPVKINVPVTEGATKVTVSFIDNDATTVKLWKVGTVDPIATQDKPAGGWVNRTFQFEGLTALVQGEELYATQVVGGVESTQSAHVIVAAFGIIEDFTVPPDPVADPAGCQDRTWHNVSPIAWSYAELTTWEGSNALKTYDGGWTNGIYANFPGAATKSGTFHVEAKVHVAESTTDTNAIRAYQVGVHVDGTCAGNGALPPCSIYGNYLGLTSGNDNAMPPQIVSTKDFDAVEGQSLQVAFSTDVQSGGWNSNSVTWPDSGTSTYILIDDIKLIDGPPPINSCSDVPVATVTGPLVAGATTVDVAGIGAVANTVTVYVNNVKRGVLDVSTTGGGTKTVPLTFGGTYTLRLGDVVKATQSYPSAGGGGDIEGCQAMPTAVVGSGPNQTPIMLTLGVREAGVSNSAAMGSDGGISGPIEWLGATTVIGGAPQGKLIYPSTAWQTVTFTMPHNPYNPGVDPDPVIAYESGNGQIDRGSPFNPKNGTFEHLAVSIPSDSPNTGPYLMWIDDPSSSGVIFGNGFEDCIPVREPTPLPWGVGTKWVMFRSARYLNSFTPYLLPTPDDSFLDDTQAYSPSKAVKLQFQFSQERRWARLTTYSLYDTPSPYYPNPVVSFVPGSQVSFKILYPPSPTPCDNPPTVTVIAPAVGPQNQTLTGVQITGTNFVAGQTQVKLYRSASGTEILADNVNVTSPTTLTCDLNLTAPPPAGTYDVMVGTCLYGRLAGGFTVCGNPTVTAISPTSGANFATVHATITGTNFSTAGDGTSVKLTRAGCPDIVGTNVVVVSSTSVTADFALPGNAPSIGQWSVVVTACGGTATLSDSFTVNCTTPAVNAPLKAGDTQVVLTNCVASPTGITVYANGLPIGTKMTGFSGTGTETVDVTALVEGDAIAATQTVGGVESCMPAGVVVGSGSNSGILLTLGIRENANLTGPVGSDGVNITPSGGSDSTYIMSWLVLDKGASAAPFTAADRATAHSTDWLAADGGEANITPTANETTSGGKTWSVFTGTAGTDHRIWLEGTSGNRVYEADGVSPDLTMCAAYAVTYVRNYGPNVSVRIRCGSDDGIKVWCNGSLRVNADVNRSYSEDATTSGSFTLYSGWNTIVVKVSENAGGWSFGLRLVKNETDVNGAYTIPVPNVEVSATRPAVLARSNMVEWFGASTTVSGAPQGKLITPNANWQTVTFTPGVDPVCNYSGGNGVLNGTYGVLDNLAITSVGTNTGPYVLYIDNVTSEGITFEDFESYTAPAEVMFHTPRTLSSANLLPGLDVATVDDTKGDASDKSNRVEFQFVDLGTNRWVRLFTGSSTTVPPVANRPNPQVRLDQPITLRVLLVPAACTPPTVSAISPSVGVQNHTNVRPHPPYDGVQVPSYTPVHATVTGTGFAPGATVKLVQAGKTDIVATNVVVVSDTQITCDIDLGGAEPGALDGEWDVVVTTCGPSAVPSPAKFTVSMCFTPRQDVDGDGDVDLSDFGIFQGCFNGPNRPYKAQAAPPMGDVRKCACLDVGDNPIAADVDLSDFNAFQGCFNGPNRPPKPGC